ncbi:MAG: hypothetical protein NTY07_07725 [Bacteroidia bacterium]|nr:hypothetical protein [Bacteroidia bacterium]
MTIGKFKAIFIKKFGKSEVSGYSSTGCFNMTGEYTDYNGRLVFPCTLSFEIY